MRVRWTKRWSRREIVEFCVNNYDRLNEAALATAWKKSDIHKLTPRAAFTALFFFTYESMPEMAQDFFHRFRTGVGLHKKSSILALYSYLNRLATGVQSRGAPEITGVIIKAWNAHAQDQDVQVLRLAKAESWPRVYGGVA